MLPSWAYPKSLLIALLTAWMLAIGLDSALLAQAAEQQAPEKSPGQQTPEKHEAPVLEYPPAARGKVVETLHGVKIADPYRWLEEASSAETTAWIEAENRLTTSFLEAIPQREQIRQRLTELWNYERYGLPEHRGSTYLYQRNDGLQNQAVLYVASALTAKPRVLLDPNELAADGTTSLADYELSNDGALLAYGLAEAGSDWQTWRVRDVASGQDRQDVVRWVKFSNLSWSADNQGFYYSRYDEPREGEALSEVNYFQKLYYHRLGTPQADDQLIYERPDNKELGLSGRVTDDGRYLMISLWRRTEQKNELWYLDLTDNAAQPVPLIEGFDAKYHFVTNDGPVFWLHTSNEAPRNRLIAVDSRRPARTEWREIIPQTDEVLQDVSLVGQRLFANYLKDAHTRIAMFSPAGLSLGDVELPGVGSVSGFNGRRGDFETFYAFTSFTTPTAIYRYDLQADQSDPWRKPQVAFDPARYETRQVFYESRDGVRVPMFIVARRGIQLDGSHPVYLYGYGGFNISLTPGFSVARIVWLEMGGIFAMPNLRGGGEYGEAWHESGCKDKKQNVFDDFIAAAEYLVREGYTTPEKLAISGRSNGGLLVGAVLTQRPELFGAALPAVGVLDMLRFHKFTIGWAWTSDYGSPEQPDEFRTLLAYSPLHNIRPGTRYPATLISTADHDDRVSPSHSFKFAAALQAAQAGPAPVLIRIERSAGHGAGTPTAKLIAEVADNYAFIVQALGLRLPEEFDAQAAAAPAPANDSAK